MFPPNGISYSLFFALLAFALFELGEHFDILGNLVEVGVPAYELVTVAFRNFRGFGGFALRSYVSTFLAQFADNLIFALLVSKLFFGWTLLQCFTCALTGAVAELLFEIFFSPLGYRMSRRILQTQKEA